MDGARRHALLASAGLVVLLLGPHAGVATAQASLVVVRFAQAARPDGAVEVAATLERPDGQLTTRVLRVVAGPCVEDVGGLESLAVLTCRDRIYEIFQRGARVEVIETTNDDARRRVRRYPLLRLRHGWGVVPRCRETADDPRACPPG